MSVHFTLMDCGLKDLIYRNIWQQYINGIETAAYTIRYVQQQKEIGVKKKLKKLYNEKSNFNNYYFIINSKQL